MSGFGTPDRPKPSPTCGGAVAVDFRRQHHGPRWAWAPGLHARTGTCAAATSSTGVSTRCKTRRSRPFQNHAAIDCQPAGGFSGRLGCLSEQAVFVAQRRNYCPTQWRLARARCRIPIPCSTLSKRQASSSSGGPAGNATAIRAAHPSGSTPIMQGTAGHGGPPLCVSRHSERMPAGQSTPSVRRASCSAVQPGPNGQRAHLRDHEQRRGTERHAVWRTSSAACLRHASHDLPIPAACCSPAIPLPGGPGDIQHFDIPSLRGICTHRTVLSLTTPRRRWKRCLSTTSSSYKFVAILATDGGHCSRRSRV